MAYIAGDVVELVCNHPTLGIYRYQAKAGESFTIDKGGIRNDDSADGITGGGQVILKKNMVRSSVEGPVAVDMLGDMELSGTNDLAASADPGTWVMSCASGAVYRMLGWPVGDLQSDTNTAQMKLKVAGSNLEQIA